LLGGFWRIPLLCMACDLEGSRTSCMASYEYQRLPNGSHLVPICPTNLQQPERMKRAQSQYQRAFSNPKSKLALSRERSLLFYIMSTLRVRSWQRGHGHVVRISAIWVQLFQTVIERAWLLQPIIQESFPRFHQNGSSESIHISSIISPSTGVGSCGFSAGRPTAPIFE
jgi:hypothetical protein